MKAWTAGFARAGSRRTPTRTYTKSPATVVKGDCPSGRRCSGGIGQHGQPHVVSQQRSQAIEVAAAAASCALAPALTRA